MGIVRTFLRDFGYLHETDVKKKTAFRAYAAAQMGRLTGDWLASQASIDNDIRAGMVPVRARARDLSQNNGYAKAYLRSVKKNVVGSEGFALQIKSVDYVDKKPVLDKLANSIIEDAFQKWSRPETATVSGKLSFRKSEELVVETTARDGEMFTRIVRGRNVNRFGFALQFIEPEFVDHNLNKDLGKGRAIRMGIEVDEWRRPIAYYVMRRANSLIDLYSTGAATSGDYNIIPASDMLHTFDPERVDQTRGVSWMAPAMLDLHNLKGYIEAAIINARIGASKMGFLRDAEGTEGEYVTPGTDPVTGEKTVEIVPGSIEDIGTRDFIPFDPKYPDQQFEPFTTSILRGIASALGVSYQTLTGDLLGTSYASGRVGLLEERETYKSMQTWFIESFLNRVFAEWLTMAIMTGAVNLPFAKYDKFNKPKWTGRRWAWVDPLKDIEAALMERKALLKSSTAIANEAGRDLEDVLQEIADEDAMMSEKGLKPDYGTTGGKTDGNQGTDAEVKDGADATGVQPRPGGGKGDGKDRRPRVLV